MGKAMTKRDTYLTWVQANKEFDLALMSGRIDWREYDRLLANYEERHGINAWEQEDWKEAMTEGEGQ